MPTVAEQLEAAALTIAQDGIKSASGDQGSINMLSPLDLLKAAQLQRTSNAAAVSPRTRLMRSLVRVSPPGMRGER